MNEKIAVIGAGISGLATAYWLYKDGFDVTVFEKNSVAGGSMVSVVHNNFLFDAGPNSGLETTPLIRQLVEDVGLEYEFIYANREANKRYILKNNILHPLPMSPTAFLKTKLFSAKAKLRLFAEPFVPPSKDGYYQSVARFVTRRLGKEFLDYAINPFVAGVYAGNPKTLSVASAFPKLYALEEKYGGLIIGTLRSIKERKRSKEVSKQSAKMFSFKKGMQTLPLTIAFKLGEKVKYNCEIKLLQKSGGSFMLNSLCNNKEETLSFDRVVFTTPAFVTSRILNNIDSLLTHHLNSIHYPPVLVLFAVYKKVDIKQPLDGFGFLIPEKENKKYLGALWSSTIFNYRTDSEHASFTLFIGGTRNASLLEGDKDILIHEILKDFHQRMKIISEPVYVNYRNWEKAIPQYDIGYVEHEKYFEEFEKKHPGIFLAGNYRGGISVGDCIKSSEIVYHRVLKSI